ncbi:MAG TPA: hypothetical protein VJ767_06000 [Nitrososphaeraceae archaeon]|nr:hypothetical protein [Nitrososphaeraceae archaeon]
MFNNISHYDDGNDGDDHVSESNYLYSVDYEIHRYCDIDIAFPINEISFGIRDAIPIKLDVKSHVIIKALCRHQQSHIFKLPADSKINWKIEQEDKENGAFKIGYGTNAEYMTRDTGNCVLFYPQLNEIRNNQATKNIKIFLTATQIGLKSFRGQRQDKFLINIEITIFKKFLKSKCKARISLEKDDSDPSKKNDLCLSYTTDDNFENENNQLLIAEKYDNLVSIKTQKSCNICNLRILFRAFNNLVRINISKSYLITSEIIKFTALRETNNCSPTTITGSKYKKHPLYDIVISPRIFWTSNLGQFICGDDGDSVLYATPGESGLSRSPVILSIHADYDLNFEQSDEQQMSFYDQKKLWLLRQPPVMGG